MKFVKGFGEFWYDFLIGDDWKIAVAVLIVLCGGLAVVLSGDYTAKVLTPILGVFVAIAFSIALAIDVRQGKSKS
jgi:uncharacterized MnhB-related membrane protein